VGAAEADGGGSMIKAPFTSDEVVALFKYQAGPMHPFTCPNRHDHPEISGDAGVLIPTVRGWICMFCDYTQDWAHEFMVRPVMSDDNRMGSGPVCEPRDDAGEEPVARA
jgi:hypothetical protein